MINSSNIFEIATPNTETTSELLGQLSSILAVGPRDDGRLYLSDMCQSPTVNRCARYKPEDYDTPENLTEEQRADNLFGFDLYTPDIVPLDREIPHALYEYRQPRGGASSLNRIRDFSGYNHYAGSPLNFIWPSNGKISQGGANVITIRFNATINNWDVYSCVKMGEIMDDVSQGCYVALLVNNGRDSYILPTDILVSEIRDNTDVMAIIAFAKDEDSLNNLADSVTNIYTFVIEDMVNDTEDTQYTIAAVASTAPYNGMTPVNETTVKSMEFKYGVDRKNLGVSLEVALEGLSGYLDATAWNTSYGDEVDSFTAISLDGTTLRVVLSTTSEWSKTNAYIVAKITSTYGWITEEGSDERMGVLTVGGYASDLAANTTEREYDIADLSRYTVWAASNAHPKTVVVELNAYVNSNLIGGIPLGMTTITL